jgi:hypothetical protein
MFHPSKNKVNVYCDINDGWFCLPPKQAQIIGNGRFRRIRPHFNGKSSIAAKRSTSSQRFYCQLHLISMSFQAKHLGTRATNKHYFLRKSIGVHLRSQSLCQGGEVAGI